MNKKKTTVSKFGEIENNMEIVTKLDEIENNMETILDYFLQEKIKISSILNTNTQNPQTLIKGLKLIQKACAPTNNANLIANFLCILVSNKDIFVTSISILIGKVIIGKIECNFLDIILDILNILIQKVPSISVDILSILLPQLHEVCKFSDETESDLQKLFKLEELMHMHNKIIISKPPEQNICTNIEPPDNFRALSIIPSKEELSNEKWFLRPAVIHGPYENIDHYLDIQYRLMREDMFRNFRKCLFEYHLNKNIESGNLYCNGFFKKVKITISGKHWHFVIPLSVTVNWETTKRLCPGSLLCLSPDGFQSCNFASIHSRQDNGKCGNICTVALLFEDDFKLTNELQLFDFIESDAHYESYKYTLEHLKQINNINFPLGSSLIDFQNCNQNPFIFKNELLKSITYNIYQHEINDDVQNEAFQLALENKVALIQGPPGTGKSYLGCQIARVLIEEQRNSLKQFIRSSPLIIMCYTNHALDQFLEKMLNYTENIIRIGGRSKSDILKPHNLKYLKLSAYNTKKTLSFEESCVVAKSKSILKNMTGENFDTNSNDNRILKRNYFNFKSESEIWNKNMEDKLQKITFPFKNNNIHAKLSDINWLSELESPKNFHGNFLDSRVFDIFRRTSHLINIHDWLMTNSTLSEAYSDIPIFCHILREELLNYIQLNNEQRNDNEEGNVINYPLEHFAKLLMKICVSDNNKFIRKYTVKQDNIKKFISKHMATNNIAIPLFLRSAIRWTNEIGIVLRNHCNSLWELELSERWKFLTTLLQLITKEKLEELEYYHLYGEMYKVDTQSLTSMFKDRDINILKYANIIGITITGAAKNFDMLKELKPTTYIIEEAAEVLESQIVTALAPSIEHLIMIGDHFQLRPTPNVYNLATKYNFDVSLFERLFKNGVPSKCLEVQHRMRQSIAHLLVPEFYPNLKNHSSVLDRKNVAGVSTNVYFLQHSCMENNDDEIKSHSNSYEASFVTNFCEYLISQGHEQSSVTILTTYVGQLNLIKKYMQKKKNVKEVLVTTVDNFQGEENDIIIISFVRSNLENKVGFIKTANRICVALSRARNGLYCIGNFKMFASQSEIWQSLLNKLIKMKSFGDSLEIHCHKHRNTTFCVKLPSDFDLYLRNGCREKCNEVLHCKHICDLFCHGPKIKHLNSLCNSKCDCYEDESVNNNDVNDNSKCKIIALRCGHKMPQSKEIVLNFICKETINLITKCGETINYSCGEEPSHINCKCPLTLPCGHSVSCNTNLELLKCKQEINKTFPCGHNASLLCYKNTTDIKCISKTTVTLPCGHTLSDILCFNRSNLNIFNCKSLCNFLLPCGHECQKNCIDCSNDYFRHRICNIPVEKLLPCSHTISRECYLIKNNDNECDIYVTVTLACGHIADTQCFNKNNLDKIQCKELCKQNLECGHECQRACFSCSSTKEHGMCHVSINKTLKCGHTTKTTCTSILYLSICNERCRYRCAHSQCLNPCYIKCFSCDKPCTWICEHYRCDKLCHELCERPPCNESCPKRYDTCGHSCPGFCGEPCPLTCPKCRGLKIPTEKAILLEDCSHLISSDELSVFLHNNEKSFPKCPECFTPITKNTRFGNVLKLYNESRHTDYQSEGIGLEVLECFRPYVQSHDFEMHIEMLWTYFKMDQTIKRTDFEMKLKYIRQLNILFCMKEYNCTLELKDEIYSKLYDEMLSKYNSIKKYSYASNREKLHKYYLLKTGIQIFKFVTLLFIQKQVEIQKIFSRVGLVNELIEDIESYLDSPHFDFSMIECIIEDIKANLKYHCPALLNFYKFLRNLCKEISIHI